MKRTCLQINQTLMNKLHMSPSGEAVYKKGQV